MNKLKITLLVITILINYPALAQTSPEVIGEKYCHKVKNSKGEEIAVKGEVETKKDSQKIKCAGSKTNARYFFEQENTKMAIDSGKEFDPEIFKSKEWFENIKDYFLEVYAKEGNDPKACKFFKSEQGFNVARCSEKDFFLDQVSLKRQQQYEAGAKQKKEDKDEINLLKILNDDWKVKFPNSKTDFTPMIFEEIKFTSIDFSNPFAKKDENIYVPGGKITWKTQFPDAGKSKFFNSAEIPSKLNFKSRNSWATPASSQDVVTNAQVESKVDKEEKVDEKVNAKVDAKEDEDTSCSDKLKQEIAKLLEHDTKNIIGLQFELTVMKMASQVVGADRVSLEGLIKKHAQDIAKADTGVIENMKQMYKRHGVQEDEQKVLDHLNQLKEKATSAYYYQKEKRFFNKDSSAFLMAFQHINPTSGINDADISVLWFMDKVSDKAINNDIKHKDMGIYQSVHNRTNLSTRIAQYTGALKSQKLQNKEELKKSLDDMVKKQKAQIDSEFKGIVESFKISNKPCYDQIFSDGEDDCNQGKVQEFFSQLLADISSKATSQDMVKLDASLKGEINGSKFSISRFVDQKPVTETKEISKNILSIPDGQTVVAEETIQSPSN